MVRDIGHKKYVAAQRARIVALAKGILSGEKSIVHASIEIVQLRRQAEEEQNPVFDIFRVIESDTDHLPVNSASDLSPQRFSEVEKELIEVEDLYRTEVITSCKEIVETLDEYELRKTKAV